MRWRQEIARVAGLPPLDLMEGFYVPFNSGNLATLYYGLGTRSEDYLRSIDERLPIKWDCLKPSPLHALLYHSDCDGELRWEDCVGIADELERLIPLLPKGEHPGHIGNWRDKTQAFIDGLRKAAEARENVDFH